MSWIADKSRNRTWNPQDQLELFWLSGGSDGSVHFEITGQSNPIRFTGSLIDKPICAGELVQFGGHDSQIWCVYGTWNTDQKKVIAAALSATKSGHGGTIRGEPYFVRFSSDGKLYRD